MQPWTIALKNDTCATNQNLQYWVVHSQKYKNRIKKTSITTVRFFFLKQLKSKDFWMGRASATVEQNMNKNQQLVYSCASLSELLYWFPNRIQNDQIGPAQPRPGSKMKDIITTVHGGWQFYAHWRATSQNGTERVGKSRPGGQQRRQGDFSWELVARKGGWGCNEGRLRIRYVVCLLVPACRSIQP